MTMGELLAAASVAARGDGGHDATAVAHVHRDQPLGPALVRMGEARQTVLPVVSRANVRQLIGIVTLGDILDAYQVSRIDQVPVAELRTDG